MSKSNIFKLALAALTECNVNNKIDLTNSLYKLVIAHQKSLQDIFDFTKSNHILELINPGRPDKPELVLPKNLPRRKLLTIEGKAALLHAICHIEFNAINLALDAVYRFQNMPEQYYLDWITIAYEEAKHFLLLKNYLLDLGYDYGSFVAHNGLWELAVNTNYDILVRMALVPRVMEARGLDATPGIINKFRAINDLRAVDILNIILDEEQGHVACGNKWYKYVCDLRNIDYIQEFKYLIKKYSVQIKLPIDRQHRLAAGFTAEELDIIENFN